MSFVICGRTIGPEQPPYIIAELSANHNDELDRAQQIIDKEAKWAVMPSRFRPTLQIR